MTEHFLLLLVCLGVIVVLAALLCAPGRGYFAALAGVGELRGITSQILAHAKTSACRVLYDAHKRISAVTKGVEKPAS